MRLVWGIVTSVDLVAQGIQQLEIAFDDGSTSRALAYPELVGECSVADRVLANTTAKVITDRTAGLVFVVARAGEFEGVALDTHSGGRTLKMQHTPLQVDVLCVEEQDSPHHDVMKESENLAGMPVVCCGVHSHVPMVAAAVKEMDPSLRVIFVMQDAGALPIALSDVIRQSVGVGLVDSTVTTGQCFGGQYDALNLHSGLVAARHVAHADVAVCAVGPGSVSTATPLGHGGVAQGEAINAAGALGGTPIAALRVSFGDTRRRQQGLSRHTVAALTKVALTSAKVGVPHLPEEYADTLERQLEQAGVWIRHERIDARSGRIAPPSMRGVEIRSMGAGLAQDPAFFAAAFAAGEVAAGIAIGR
ncbi:MAG: DUF3866 family protein [Actinomycetota bacterium]|jgi:hypothetical protein|nr:DUF3866 family protein [Actinomycetota bacterium]